MCLLRFLYSGLSAVQQQHVLRKLEQNAKYLFLQLWSMAVSLLASGYPAQLYYTTLPLLVSLDAPLRRAFRQNCPVVSIVKPRLNRKQFAS